jgi:H+/gluconate symporter-like permease
MVDVLIVLLSLILLIYFAYRGMSVLYLAPMLATLAVVLSSEKLAISIYTEVFMTGVAGFLRSFFPLFLLGALFGRLMQDSGSARAIAIEIQKKLGSRHAILSVIIACAVLTYGGVSLFVVAFAVLPVACSIFKEAGIPKKLIPATLALGSFTFTMTALPGTPQIQNSIPMPYYGTDLYAAPTLGLIAAVIMLGLGYLWISGRAKKMALKEQGYYQDLTSEEIQIEEKSFVNHATQLPAFWVAITPIFVVLIFNFYLGQHYFPSLTNLNQLTDLSDAALKKSVGLWSLILTLLVAIVVTILLNWRRFNSVSNSLNQGATGSLLPVLNTASEVGYGSVIATLAGFALLREALLNVSSNPLIAQSLSVTTLAGITGSASGGLSIALEALSSEFLKLAELASISPEVLHRTAVIASGGLDSLPHNGAVITLLTISRLTHRQSYLDIGIVSVVIPVFALVVILFIHQWGIL